MRICVRTWPTILTGGAITAAVIVEIALGPEHFYHHCKILVSGPESSVSTHPGNSVVSGPGKMEAIILSSGPSRPLDAQCVLGCG